MKTQDVKLYAAQQLHRLQALPDNQRRAELAKLRRGIGHAPGDLPERIRDFCRETGQPVPESVGAVVRCIYESLAMKYRFALDQISARTGRQFNVLHLLGGGTKDGFLCQMTADSLAFPVIAGPTEATALGNMLLQLIALGQLPDVAAGRELIRKTETLKTYEPKPTAARDRAYRDFQNILR